MPRRLAKDLQRPRDDQLKPLHFPDEAPERQTGDTVGTADANSLDFSCTAGRLSPGSCAVPVSGPSVPIPNRCPPGRCSQRQEAGSEGGQYTRGVKAPFTQRKGLSPVLLLWCLFCLSVLIPPFLSEPDKGLAS